MPYLCTVFRKNRDIHWEYLSGVKPPQDKSHKLPNDKISHKLINPSTYKLQNNVKVHPYGLAQVPFRQSMPTLRHLFRHPQWHPLHGQNMQPEYRRTYGATSRPTQSIRSNTHCYQGTFHSGPCRVCRRLQVQPGQVSHTKRLHLRQRNG